MADDILNIELPTENTVFLPMEQISLELSWSLEKPPERIELRTVWNTVGKGTTDIGVADVVIYESPDQAGTENLSLTLPEAPYSFSGKYVSLQWALELVAVPAQTSYRQEISLVPRAGHVVLSSNNDDFSNDDDSMDAAFED